MAPRWSNMYHNEWKDKAKSRSHTVTRTQPNGRNNGNTYTATDAEGNVHGKFDDFTQSGFYHGLDGKNRALSKKAKLMKEAKEVAMGLLESNAALAHEAKTNWEKHQGMMAHHDDMEYKLRDAGDHDTAQKHSQASELHLHASTHFNKAMTMAGNRNRSSAQTHMSLGHSYAQDAMEHEHKHELKLHEALVEARKKPEPHHWIQVEAGSHQDAHAVARNMGHEPVESERMNAQKYDVKVKGRPKPKLKPVEEGLLGNAPPTTRVGAKAYGAHVMKQRVDNARARKMGFRNAKAQEDPGYESRKDTATQADVNDHKRGLRKESLDESYEKTHAHLVSLGVPSHHISQTSGSDGDWAFIDHRDQGDYKKKKIHDKIVGSIKSGKLHHDEADKGSLFRIKG